MVTRRSVNLAYFWKASSTCSASSRVGSRIRQRIAPCWPSRWMIGSAKAAVLPVPVWAEPMTSPNPGESPGSPGPGSASARCSPSAGPRRRGRRRGRASKTRCPSSARRPGRPAWRRAAPDARNRPGRDGPGVRRCLWLSEWRQHLDGSTGPRPRACRSSAGIGTPDGSAARFLLPGLGRAALRGGVDRDPSWGLGAGLCGRAAPAGPALRGAASTLGAGRALGGGRGFLGAGAIVSRSRAMNFRNMIWMKGPQSRLSPSFATPLSPGRRFVEASTGSRREGMFEARVR
jgi:hypothetical protein